jgi:hypothetical protein
LGRLQLWVEIDFELTKKIKLGAEFYRPLPTCVEVLEGAFADR